MPYGFSTQFGRINKTRSGAVAPVRVVFSSKSSLPMATWPRYELAGIDSALKPRLLSSENIHDVPKNYTGSSSRTRKHVRNLPGWFGTNRNHPPEFWFCNHSCRIDHLTSGENAHSSSTGQFLFAFYPAYAFPLFFFHWARLAFLFFWFVIHVKNKKHGTSLSLAHVPGFLGPCQ